MQAKQIMLTCNQNVTEQRFQNPKETDSSQNGIQAALGSTPPTM